MRRQIQAITVKSVCSKRIDRVSVEADHGDRVGNHTAPRYLAAAAATGRLGAGRDTERHVTASDTGCITSVRFADVAPCAPATRLLATRQWSGSRQRQRSLLRTAGLTRLMRRERLARLSCSARG